MQVCQGGLAVHQHSTPNKRADTTQDDTELVDAEQWSSGSHALRVAQRSVPLKGSPRYLALSSPRVAVDLPCLRYGSPAGTSLSTTFPFLAQEVFELVHELLRVKVIITLWARHLVTWRVIGLL